MHFTRVTPSSLRLQAKLNAFVTDIYILTYDYTSNGASLARIGKLIHLDYDCYQALPPAICSIHLDRTYLQGHIQLPPEADIKLSRSVSRKIIRLTCRFQKVYELFLCLLHPHSA